VIHLAIVAMIVAAVAAAPAGCGSATAAPSPSTATASTGTTAGTSAADADAAKAIQAMADYTTALKKWFHDFSADFADEADKALAFQDPYQPTKSELLRARQFTDEMRKSVSKLAAIGTPTKVAKAHAQLCAALLGDVDALERYVNAVDWGSERDIELAMRGAEQAHTLYDQAVQGLGPYVDLTGVMSN